MFIYGASGHAKVIIDIITSKKNESIDFIFDDDHSIKELQGFKVNHEFTTEMLSQKTVIAIGNNRTRKKISENIEYMFCDALIHSSAVLSEKTQIGQGTVVMPNAVVNSSSQIGSHCIINTGSIVEHDVKIGNYAHVSPASTITGNVQIGEGTQIGAGATIIPGIKIGRWVTVGAGAVIINDIPDFSVVVGNPGRIVKYNKIEDE